MSERISRRDLFAREYRPLRVAVASAIAAADPIRLLELGAPGDEYEPEVSAVLPRLKQAKSTTDVCAIVHQEFVHRFGAEVAGPIEKYEAPARVIWRALRGGEPH